MSVVAVDGLAAVVQPGDAEHGPPVRARGVRVLELDLDLDAVLVVATGHAGLERAAPRALEPDAMQRDRALLGVELVPLVELEGHGLVDRRLRRRRRGQERRRQQGEHPRGARHPASFATRIVSWGRPPVRSPGPGADAIIRCLARALGRRDVTLASGTTFGPYQILDPLGRGGMATVYKAYEPGLDRYVALKVLPQRVPARRGVRRALPARGQGRSPASSTRTSSPSTTSASTSRAARRGWPCG